ncbi:response regulator receiver domain [Skermanella pratensis]|uniref:response regulator receiver domain n=1 Tax=Skermanella pratensis TaxID=2233999 RepID=UPI0013018240|nr:response regulator receiver domain [Skermanella pratensis]
MSEAAAATVPEANLSTLVQETFIDPIRSVLIIDDRYPTWEKIFGESGYDPTNNKWADREKMLQVVSQFRAKSPALTVDIHDGTDNAQISSYLHQSDLLVLDYHLESSAPYGVLAADILRRLMNSTHFNLVVVHTEIDDLIEPFNNILLSLLPPSRTNQIRSRAAK